QVTSPASAPAAGFLAIPTMLSNSKAVDVKDLSGTPFLTVKPTDTATWPPLFGVQAAPSGALFSLEVDYDPPGAANPVQVGGFDGLSLTTVATEVNGKSQLIAVEIVASTAKAGLSAFALANDDPNLAVPAITLSGTSNQSTALWRPMQDLLENGESDKVFVVE